MPFEIHVFPLTMAVPHVGSACRNASTKLNVRGNWESLTTLAALNYSYPSLHFRYVQRGRVASSIEPTRWHASINIHWRALSGLQQRPLSLGVVIALQRFIIDFWSDLVSLGVSVCGSTLPQIMRQVEAVGRHQMTSKSSLRVYPFLGFVLRRVWTGQESLVGPSLSSSSNGSKGYLVEVSIRIGESCWLRSWPSSYVRGYQYLLCLQLELLTSLRAMDLILWLNHLMKFKRMGLIFDLRCECIVCWLFHEYKCS